jgi:hypothetical protein
MALLQTAQAKMLVLGTCKVAIPKRGARREGKKQKEGSNDWLAKDTRLGRARGSTRLCGCNWPDDFAPKAPRPWSPQLFNLMLAHVQLPAAAAAAAAAAASNSRGLYRRHMRRPLSIKPPRRQIRNTCHGVKQQLAACLLHV